MNRLSPILTLVVILWPCCAFAQPCDSLGPLQWLSGEWIAQDERRITSEIWEQVSTDTFEGRGAVTSRATMQQQITETLRLVAMSGEIFYLAKTADNALPVAFRLAECAEETFVFENKAHDFPKQLKYQRVGSDSLIVYVSDGASRGFALRFGRKAGER